MFIMQRVQYFIISLFFLPMGMFFCYHSRRLTFRLIKSTHDLDKALNIKKRSFGRGAEIFIRITLIIFGIIFILTGVRIILEGLK